MKEDDLYLMDINNWSKYGGEMYCPKCLEMPRYMERWPRHISIDKWVIRFKCDCGLIENYEKLLTREERTNRKRTDLINKMLK